MRGKPDSFGTRAGIAGALALVLGTAGCFADPGNADDGEEGTDESTGNPDTNGEDSTTGDSGDEDSTTEDSGSETGEPVPDMGSEDTGEPEPECLWIRLGENSDDDIKAVTTDTWIDEENPTANNGDDDDLRADGISEGGLTETTLIRFDVSSVPEGLVTDAMLVLATNGDEGSESSPGSQFSLHLMAQAWIEDQATWLEASQGVPWSVLGCAAAPCRGDEELVFFEPTEQNASYELPFDPAIVETWRSDATTNHGLLLTTPASNGGHFHSSESKDHAMRPALVLRVCSDA